MKLQKSITFTPTSGPEGELGLLERVISMTNARYQKANGK
jgi:hypothetical protein